MIFLCYNSLHYEPAPTKTTATAATRPTQQISDEIFQHAHDDWECGWRHRIHHHLRSSVSHARTRRTRADCRFVVWHPNVLADCSNCRTEFSSVRETRSRMSFFMRNIKLIHATRTNKEIFHFCSVFLNQRKLRTATSAVHSHHSHQSATHLPPSSREFSAHQPFQKFLQFLTIIQFPKTQ